MTVALTKSEIVDVITSYVENLESAQSIAKRYKRTRQGILKLLKQAGIDTSKRLIPVSCSSCGSEILRPKCHLRDRKRVFCNMDCYYAYLDASQDGKYTYSRMGMRIAREKVSAVFELKDGYVVHHKDRNTLNNDLSNLMVFANHGDHTRYHRLGADYAAPLWDGSR